MARYVVLKRDPKTGKEWFEFLPMIFEGPSDDAVTEAAQAFWAAEQLKTAARAENLAKARKARAA